MPSDPTCPVAILLVEDDEAIREALSDVLVDAAYSVRCAEHGKHALAILEAGFRPELILLDLMMPVMDGWELMQRLDACAELAHIPIVTVSAARSSQPTKACRSLAKPVDIDAVLEAVERHRLRAAHGPTGEPPAASAHQLHEAHLRAAASRQAASQASK